ncbi:rRNA cytosine-C5-methylase [Kordiimonas sediminis]|uniref:rRNA cytosine-C5-methylase n=1 Tax=Kordiimonas sediminis TaxID=1735581 RepID=A0A919E9I1_9PROT|nr:RsmB/NOP family class I SAM-dependent RNA methyltransferase [Kordiimonas sediminis]GHF27232.1 rRNA cytosine-C5-methylase [Kordiimonas sediminis]
MTPDARLQAVIELLDQILAGAQSNGAPADKIVASYFRQRRYAGSKDRRAVNEIVYKIIRDFERHRYLLEVNPSMQVNVSGRSLLLAHFIISEASLPQFDVGDTFTPAPWSAEETIWYENTRELYADFAVPEDIALNVPEWAAEGMHARFSVAFANEASALNTKAPLCLRVNTLKADMEDMLPCLNKNEEVFVKSNISGLCISADTAINLEGCKPYKIGQIEVQDEAAQIASLLVYAEAGHQIVDLCAGAGGKTLAVAADMNNQGQIYCFDTHKSRLAGLSKRAKRAGVHCIQQKVIPEDQQTRQHMLAPYTQKMDRVILDVPCSGTGTWRRSPDLRMRFDGKRLDDILELQQQLLREGAELVKPGGRLIYMTCSLLPSENEKQIHRFTEQANSKFSLIDYRDVWNAKQHLKVMPQTLSNIPEALCLSPGTHNTDGFFVCILERSTEK